MVEGKIQHTENKWQVRQQIIEMRKPLRMFSNASSKLKTDGSIFTNYFYPYLQFISKVKVSALKLFERMLIDFLTEIIIRNTIVS